MLKWLDSKLRSAPGLPISCREHWECSVTVGLQARALASAITHCLFKQAALSWSHGVLPTSAASCHQQQDLRVPPAVQLLSFDLNDGSSTDTQRMECWYCWGGVVVKPFSQPVAYSSTDLMAASWRKEHDFPRAASHSFVLQWPPFEAVSGTMPV